VGVSAGSGNEAFRTFTEIGKSTTENDILTEEGAVFEGPSKENGWPRTIKVPIKSFGYS
jgi:hypothetical protein